MEPDPKPTKKRRKVDRLERENSTRELTFAYALECLQESTNLQQFLGFTLSRDYAPVHKARSEELSKLQEYFPLEVLKAVAVWAVNGQTEKVIKWTDRDAMDAYLRLHSAI